MACKSLAKDLQNNLLNFYFNNKVYAKQNRRRTIATRTITKNRV